MGFKVAVVGATGNVGREMLAILSERKFPASEVVALASSRSVGTEVSFGDKVLKCRALDNYDFADTDIALMSAGGDVSKAWSPKIGQQGCVVIDNSSAWRYDADVPLIVPEVNADAVKGFTKKNIIANPNCSTAQLVVALKPLTYMNLSGKSVAALARFFKITPQEILVVHDELDLLPGQMKLKLGGSPAGHNGLKDIHAQLGSDQIWRLKLGIGHPGNKGEVADYVLRKPPTQEREAIEKTGYAWRADGPTLPEAMLAARAWRKPRCIACSVPARPLPASGVA